MALHNVKPSPLRRTVPYPKTASNVQTEGGVAYLTSGKASIAASAANAAVVAGIINKPVAATDADYASNTINGYEVDEEGVWSIPVGTSTNFAIGLLCDGSSTGQTLDCANTTYKTFAIVGGDTTTALVRIRRWAHNDPGASVT